MKKLTLSVVALLAMGTVVMAETFDAYGPGSYQNSVAPKPRADYTQPAPYIGIAYTYISGSDDFTISRIGTLPIDLVGNEDFSNSAVTINAGFDFNQYIAAEIRYTGTIDDTNINTQRGQLYSGENVSNFGGYIKPQYRNGTGTLYGLLGYGKASFGENDNGQFQYGAGFSFDFENGMSLFFDYLRLYNDSVTYKTTKLLPVGNERTVTEDVTLDAFSFGISYRF